MNLESFVAELQSWATLALSYLTAPWFAYQLAIIVVLFGLAKLLSLRVEPRLEARAREIRGHPGLLRVVVALLRRIEWIFFSLFLFIALTVMRSVTWPSRSHFIAIALSLSLAWLFVSVLSRVIRNRLVARTLSWLAWIYVALVILGFDDEAGTFL
nr:mechanosensitive ion channel family protein [Pseudomonadota bacterium]